MPRVSVAESTRKKVRALGATDLPLGRAAVRVAQLLDEAEPRDAATLSRELRLLMESLDSSAVPTGVDSLDEIRKRRERRRTGA